MRATITLFSLVALVIYCLLSAAADRIEAGSRRAAQVAEQRVEEIQ
jgi:type II secretory pathway component PulJ